MRKNMVGSFTKKTSRGKAHDVVMGLSSAYTWEFVLNVVSTNIATLLVWVMSRNHAPLTSP